MVKSNKLPTPMKKSSILLIALVLSTSTLWAGGPWTQKKGKGYFKLSEWWIIFNQHYTDAGLIDPNITTGIFNTTFYGEYGLSDRFTTMLYVPLLSRNYMNNLVSSTTGETLIPGEAINTLGDTDLGFKYSLTKPGSKWPVAATLTLGIPTGTPVAGSLNNLQTGDGEFNQILQVDAGRSFQIKKKVNSYVSGYVGFNHRTNGFSEEFRYGIETGVGLFNSKLWLIARLLGVESFKNGATAETVTSTSLFANNTEYTSYSFEAAYYVQKRVGFSFSYASAFRGEIIAAAPTYSVGVFYDLSR